MHPGAGRRAGDVVFSEARRTGGVAVLGPLAERRFQAPDRSWSAPGRGGRRPGGRALAERHAPRAQRVEDRDADHRGDGCEDPPAPRARTTERAGEDTQVHAVTGHARPQPTGRLPRGEDAGGAGR